MKIAICCPIYGDPKARFVMSLLALHERILRTKVTYNGTPVFPDVRVIFHQGNSRLDAARSELASEALDWACDYILWLDADHTFSADAAFRLAAHDLPIVGANYAARGRNHWSSAYHLRGEGIERVAPRADGLEAVDVIGLGVCLTKRAVYEKVPAPWFVGGEDGEDGYFCRKAKVHGFVPHVDHGLHVGHIDETVLILPR